MRTLYGSTSWRRVLALVLVFVMMVSTMGTSGYSVFAEDLVETNEEVTVSEPEATVPEVTEDIQGPSPGEEAATDDEADPALVEGTEASEEDEEPADAEPVEATEEGEEPADAEPVEATEEGEEPADAEPVEATEEGEEPADAETVEETEEAEPVEPAEETLISEAAKVIEGDDGEAVAEPVEPAEELPEEEILEEVVAMPAIDAEKLFDDARVTVSAPEGAFPEGTTVNIEEVTLGRTQSAAIENAVEAKVVSYKAYDITFNNGDQTDMQPAEGYAVKVNIEPYSMPAAENLQVVHMEDRRTAQVVESEATEEGLAFDAEHFSVYVVVATGDDARLEVVFHQADGSTVSIFVKKADLTDTTDQTFNTVLYDPGVGSLDAGVLFSGWTTKQNYTTADVDGALTIDGVRNAVKEKLQAGGFNDGEKMEYYPMLFKAFTITYLDPKGTIISCDEPLFLITEENPKYTFNETYDPETAEQAFLGWREIVGEGYGQVYQNGDEITLTKNVTVMARAPYGKWLIFSENFKGVSYTAPQFVVDVPEGATPIDENKTHEPDDPIKNGYTFGGWWTKKGANDGEVDGEQYTFGNTLSANTTLYAKWTPATNANYNVIVWKQSLEDPEKYDFAQNITLEGVSGQTINTVTQTGSNVNTGTTPAQTRNVRVNGTEIAYTGFHCAKFDSNVTIAPEGNSVLNVYYDRNTITINFDAGNNRYIKNENKNPATYTRRVTYTGLYEAPLTFDWPTQRFTNNQGTNGSNILWQYSEGYTTTTLSLIGSFKLPNNSAVSISFTADDSGDNEVRFYQMNENGEYSNTVKDRAGFDSNLDGFTFTEKYTGYELDQYRYHRGNNWSDWTTVKDGDKAPEFGFGSNHIDQLEIRYKRVKGIINYMDGVYVDGNNNKLTIDNRNQLNQSAEIYYGADVTSYAKGGTNQYIPTYDNFVFDDWYADEGCTVKYSFTTMPSTNITVYAKWVQVQYRVFLHAEGGTFVTGQDPDFRIDYNGKVKNPGIEREGYTLVGWYVGTANECDYSKSWNCDVLVGNDINITEAYKPTSGSDVNRPWITRQLNLYAKWRSILDGADGINVQYDPGAGTLTYDDTVIYVDQAKATAAPAATPTDSKLVFSHWVMQKWDESKNNFVDIDPEVDIMAGASFTVALANAHKEAGTTEGKYTYTVQLRAEYTNKQEALDTHITWFANNKTDNAVTDKIIGEGENAHQLAINEAVNIRPANTFSYTGYEFIGWARYEEGSTPSSPTDDAKLWLVYDKDSDSFTCDGNTAEQVAADEKQLYHDLYAVWSPEEYTITYNLEGGSLSEGTTNPGTYTVNSDTITLNNPSLEGYVFAGWTGTGLTEPTMTVIIPTGSTGNREYTATWSQIYTVTFDANGHGTAPDAQTVAYNGKAIKPNDLTETGWTFGGWYTEAACTTEYDFNAAVTSNITLYAKWTAVELTVTFDANGHGTAPDAQTVAYNGKAIKPNDLTETGWTFGGWYTEAACTTEYDFNAAVTSNITLYAKWTVKTYTVIWQNEDKTELERDENVPYGTMPEYNGKTPTKESTDAKNYSFNGWTPDVVAVETDAVYTAKYTEAAQQYNVTFVDEDGETVLLAEKAYDYGTPVDKIEKPADPTKAATATHTYTFAGWTPELSPVTANAVYKATYTEEAITYTIIYHSNYQSVVSTETEDDPIAVENATTIVTFNDVLGPNNQKFSKTSPWTNGNKTYTFAGWKDANGKEYPLGDYTGDGAVLEGQTSGNDQQPATNDAGAVNTATSSLRSGLRMAFTTSFGGTLELWAQWTESTSGGGNNPRPRPNPDPTDEPEEPIDDPDTPLAPPEEEDTEIDDGDTPLAPGTIDDETEIDEEATPLSPFTGDDRHTDVWAFLSVLSLAGIVLLGRKRKEEE